VKRESWTADTPRKPADDMAASKAVLPADVHTQAYQALPELIESRACLLLYSFRPFAEWNVNARRLIARQPAFPVSRVPTLAHLQQYKSFIAFPSCVRLASSPRQQPTSPHAASWRILQFVNYGKLSAPS